VGIKNWAHDGEINNAFALPGGFIYIKRFGLQRGTPVVAQFESPVPLLEQEGWREAPGW
jgi:hypothetical protein